MMSRGLGAHKLFPRIFNQNQNKNQFHSLALYMRKRVMIKFCRIWGDFYVPIFAQNGLVISWVYVYCSCMYNMSFGNSPNLDLQSD